MFVCFLAFFCIFGRLWENAYFFRCIEEIRQYFSVFISALWQSKSCGNRLLFESLSHCRKSRRARAKDRLFRRFQVKRENLREEFFAVVLLFRRAIFARPLAWNAWNCDYIATLRFFCLSILTLRTMFFFAVYEIKNVLFWNWFFLLRMFCSFVVFGSCFAFLWFWDEICAVCCRHFRREEKSSLLRIPSAPKFAEYSHRRNIR